MTLNFLWTFCVTPKPLKQHFFPLNKVRMSSTKGCLLSPPPSLPPQDNLVRRPTESKFESENINTTVCSPKRKKWSIFNLVFQNTQLCDFLIYCIPDSSRLAFLSLTHPLDLEDGADFNQSRVWVQRSQRTAPSGTLLAQAGAPISLDLKGAWFPRLAAAGSKVSCHLF